MKSLRVTRVSGAQNTFFIADAINGDWKSIYPRLSVEEKRKIAIHLCQLDPKTDGFLFLIPRSELDFAWDFFNSDGSFAEMCGNAARCATMFFHQRIKHQENIRFFTGAGDIGAEVLNDETIKVEMSPTSPVKRMTVLNCEGLWVDTGVPHFVIERSPDAFLAKQFRKVSDFGPQGSNITFVQNLGSQSLEAVTFERGVEDFTRACGTGAVAAAVYFQDKKGYKETVTVRMPGGELVVQSIHTGKRPYLTGNVEIEFDLQLDQEKIGIKL